MLNDLMSKVPGQRQDARTTAAHLTALQHSDPPRVRAGVSNPPSSTSRETDRSHWLPTQTSTSEQEKLALPVPDQPLSGRLSGTLEGHHGAILAMAFSPDGRLLATCDTHSDFRIWDIATGGSLHQLPIAGFAIAFRPDGRLVAAGSYQAVHLLDPATGRQLRNIPIPSTDHKGGNVSLSFTPDGRRLALCRAVDQQVLLWDSTTGERNGEVKLKAWGAEILRRARGDNARFARSAFSPNMDVLATSDSRTVQLWDPLSGKRLCSIGGSGSSEYSTRYSIAFSGDGRALATRSPDDMIRLWDCGTGKNILTFEGPLHRSGRRFSGRGLAFGLHDRLLAVDVVRGAAQLRDTGTGQILSTIPSPDPDPPDISCLAFSPDGRLLVIGGNYPMTSRKFPKIRPIDFPAQVQIWELT